MYPFSKQIIKPLLPILNKPILFHSIENLIKAGIINIGIVVRKNDRKFIKQSVEKNFDYNFDFIVQESPLGTGNAVQCVRPHLQTANMLIIAGDSLFPLDFIREICQVHQYDTNTITLAIEPMPFEQMQHCSTVDYRSGRVWEIREKPASREEILSEFNSAAFYVFTDTIFKALNNIKKSIRNEYELASAINLVIQQNERVGGSVVDQVYHLSNVNDLWRVNMELLENTKEKDTSGNLIGKAVDIHNTAKIQNSIIGDNSTIHEGIQLKNTVILPNSTINQDFSNSLVLANDSETFIHN
jgi:glucose-1-phosphate thymidylyltransferase